MRWFRFLVLVIATGSGVLLAPAAASAHDLRAIVTVADEVKVLAHFDDEVPAEFAAVTVLDATGNEVTAGKTDERGTWTFARPAPGEYVLTVESSGHVARVSFRVDAEPGTVPIEFTGWRLNRLIGITIGLVLLLGFSAISWLIRRQRRG